MLSSTLKFSAVAALLSGVSAQYDPQSGNNVATYWGQNTAGVTGGSNQQPLGTYCEDSNIDIIPMAFLLTTNPPTINLANIGDGCIQGANGALTCPQVGADIKKCQSMGKKIVLSIGGATYTEGGFASEADAETAAQNLWNTFGPGGNSTGGARPFGDASIDGFDFDFEAPVTNMVAFGNKLREVMDASGPGYLLTAAPQCPFPDANNNEMLNGAVAFDIVWVQFYNNYCGVNNPDQFNFKDWDEWATTTSKNPDVKIMVGVPASPGSASTGYVDADQLATLIATVKDKPSFGGVMMWDVSSAYANQGFLDGVKSAVGGAGAKAKRVMRRGLRAAHSA